ncbi:MAG: ABC transporter permease [Saprospiraceae bacterium]|nr:MAG: ABC transporter permease [Saprospiraceae bacterium]
MIQNYLKITLRRLFKDRAYTLLNIAGLALGMSCFLLIALYVLEEKNYDRWMPGHEQVQRIAMDITTVQGDHLFFAPASGTLAGALMEYPQVEAATRILPASNERLLVTSEDRQQKFYESGLFYADANIFEVFSYPLMEGDPATALSEPMSIVVSAEVANRFFGKRESYLGQVLVIENQPYIINGVLKDLPATTSFRPQIMASMEEFKGRRFLENWHATIFHTFIKTGVEVDVAAFEQQIAHIANKYVEKEIKNNAQGYRYFIQPLASIHLHSDLRYEFSKNNSATYLNIFILIALFILFIAGVNFVNLATARATRRAKEVGVRKVTGANRSQLIGQFLGESLMVSALAACLAFVLVQLALPMFNFIADKQLASTDLFASSFIALAVAVTLLAGLLAGAYPAWYLSRFEPAAIFQDKIAGRQGGLWLRNSLVVGQFVISIFIIVATLVVGKQLSFLKQQSLGFDQEQMLVVHAPGGSMIGQKLGVLRQTFASHPAVSGVSASATIPGRGTSNNLIKSQEDPSRSTDMQLIQVDEDFLETYNIPLLAGRNISESLPSDTTGDLQSVLINEACLPVFGWQKPEEAIGKIFDGGWGTVIGVVKDFHYTSLQTEVAPLMMFYSPRSFEYLTLKVNTTNLSETMASLEQTWKAQVTSHPFTYFFLDEDFNKQYSSETRLGRLFNAFSLIAIMIACLGLFGLAAYSITQRTKEIGIRKVLGASVSSVVGLLSKDFLKLVIVAIIIAMPLAWLFMNRWLEDFAYRINLQWWLFALAGAGALAIAFLTVSFQSIKAALANPVKSLRSE